MNEVIIFLLSLVISQPTQLCSINMFSLANMIKGNCIRITIFFESAASTDGGDQLHVSFSRLKYSMLWLGASRWFSD